MSSPTPALTGRDDERGAAHRGDREELAGIVTLSVGVTALAVAVMVRTDSLPLPLWLRTVVGVALGLGISVLTWRLVQPWRHPAPQPAVEAPSEPMPYAEPDDLVRPLGPDGDPLPDADLADPAYPNDPPDPLPSPDREPALPPDPARWRDLEVNAGDKRALILLVRSLEATLEEQHAAITALQALGTRSPDIDHDALTAPEALPYAASDAGAETEHGPRRTQLAMEALSHLEGPAASARVDAAIGRLGAPALFVRPPLAAFLPRPEAADQPPITDAEPVPEPAPEPQSVTQPVPEPVPEVVLPVPARTTVIPGPRRRRLFRNSAA
jgi:hypothetical protein